MGSWWTNEQGRRAGHEPLCAAPGRPRLLHHQGRAAERRGPLAPVYASTEGFGFLDLVDARLLLKELGAAPADDEGYRSSAPLPPAGPDVTVSPLPTR